MSYVMNPAIDISTHELAQLTEKAMGGKVALEEILAVWHEIGKMEIINVAIFVEKNN